MNTVEATEQPPSYEELLAETALLKRQVAELREVVATLKAHIEAFEDRLSKDSHNSSKPPSSDLFGKQTKSLRKRSDKSTGGQKGHGGKRLELVSEPDETVVHAVVCCCACGAELSNEACIEVLRRQVFEVPPLRLRVTEHQAEAKRCYECGVLSRAAFPDEVRQPTQYGARLKGLTQYLLHYQLLPLARTQELFNDLFNHSLSQGTLVNASERCYQELAEVETRIKRAIVESEVICVDETGCAAQGRRQWLHVSSTPELTFYEVHAKRGRAALDAIDLLPRFEGVAVHDAYASYHAYGCHHALCNAHLLRELTFLQERHQQHWAKELAELLVTVKATCAAAFDLIPSPSAQAAFAARYAAIVAAGLAAQPPPEKSPLGKRGRRKQSKAKNLLDRLASRQEEVLHFMYDPQVPFDNNLAERDLRMMKVQQKISGCFRGEGATYFCRIRGYISTLRKQQLSVLAGLESVFAGQPMFPCLGAE